MSFQTFRKIAITPTAAPDEVIQWADLAGALHQRDGAGPVQSVADAAGATSLSADIVAGLQGAANLSGANPVATMADVSSRWVDLGVLDIPTILATGLAPTLRAYSADELIVQVKFSADGYVVPDGTLLGNSYAGFLTPDTIAQIGALAVVGVSIAPIDTLGQQITNFGIGPDVANQGPTNAAMILFAGPLTFGLTTGVPAEGTWVALTAFVGTIVAAGHAWSSNSGGDSGAVEPTWANGFGATIVDGDITWTDLGDLPTVGAVHAYVEVVTVS